ncbi:MAG: hypothetical protein ACR2PT_11150 [Endozoicomonas sp.]
MQGSADGVKAKRLARLTSQDYGLPFKLIADSPRHFKPFIKDQIASVGGAAFTGLAYLGKQPLGVIAMELIGIAYIAAGLQSGGWIRQSVGKGGDAMSWLYQLQLGRQRVVQRAQTKAQVLAHYAELKDDQGYAMAEMLLDAMPDIDVFVVTAEFIIKNVDHKFARACANAGKNPEIKGECRLQDLPSEFYGDILPYRSGAESELEMFLETSERLGVPHPFEKNAAIHKKEHKEEQFCNNQRWIGLACAVRWDPVTGVRVADSQGVTNTEQVSRELLAMPFVYNYFSKADKHTAVPYSADRQMGERSVYVLSPEELVEIDLVDIYDKEALICHAWKNKVRPYLRVPAGVRSIMLEDIKGRYFHVPPESGTEARCDKFSAGFEIKIIEE